MRATNGLVLVPLAGILLSCSSGGGSPQVAPPTIASFTATPATITAGQNSTLAWSVSGATSLSLSPGPGTVSGTSVPVSPAATATYTLTATNAGGSDTKTATVTVVPPPSITSFTAAAGLIYPGQSTTLTATFSNGTGSISGGVGAVQSGTPVTVTPAATATYTLTVTNVANSSVTMDRQVVLETQATSIASLTASPSLVPMGSPSALAWVLGGGVPNSLTLDGASMLGQSGASVFPVRRQSFLLQAGNPIGGASKSVVAVGQGLDAFAGSVLGGPGAEDGLGTDARVYYPDGMWCDGQGNLFVTMWGDNTIRKATPSGQTSTLAGTAGASGSDEGVGPAARFKIPVGVVGDPAGNLYICDMNNNTIRRWSADGTVSTFAGLAGSPGTTEGTGSAARFNQPYGITRDSVGNLFVADAGNNRIRKITPAGVVSTFAGSTFGNLDGTGTGAKFNYPTHLGIDGADNLYVADTSNHCIRKITPAGVVTRMAGTGAAGHADGTGTAASFSSPRGLAVDSAGNVFVGDTVNHLVRKITPVGVVTTLAGTAQQTGTADGTGAAARFNYIWSMAISPSGDLFAGDDSNATVRRITQAGVVTTFLGRAVEWGTTNGPAATARFNQPMGSVCDPDGNIFVADYGNHAIRKISSSGTVTTIAGTAGTPGNADGIGLAASFRAPNRILRDPDGNLFVSDSGNYRIRKIDPSGTVTTVAGSDYGFLNGTGTGAKFGYPMGLAMDDSRNLYVADASTNSIRKITPAGVVTTLAGNGSAGPGDGTGAAARFYFPYGIAFSAGVLYVADSQNNAIRAVTLAGAVTTLAGTPGTPGGFQDGTGATAKFSFPYDLVADAQGNLWVCDEGNRAIRKVTPAGVTTTLMGSQTSRRSTSTGPFATAGLGFPGSISLTPAGDLLVTVGNGLVLLTAPNGQ